MCIGYKFEGKVLESWPIQHEIIENCEPIYKEYKGWDKRTSDEWTKIAEQGYEALPDSMKVYLQAIKEEINAEIAMVSIGPKRIDTIVLDDNLF